MEPMSTPIQKKEWIHHEKGVTFFDRSTERVFFFFMTLIMLALGLLYKFGVI